jgi:mono/diheme cytochrome c family protein
MNNKIGTIAALASVSLLLMGHLPANADTELDMALVEQGKQIFETVGGVGCKTCHGAFGEGKVGPANRGVNEASIKEAIARIPAMQFLREQVSDEDIKKVAAYTDWMGRHMLVKALLKRGQFIPEKVIVYPGTAIQLVIENTGTEPNSIRSDGMESAPVHIPARDLASLVWTAPSDEGTFTIVCSDCKIKNGLLTIEVTKAAKPYIPPPQPKVSPKM